MDIFNTLALIMLCIISIAGVYVVIYIHDIPYEIAKKRNHPHQDAIHMAGWVSLFLMHTIWPILWIWAYLFKPGSPEQEPQEVGKPGDSGDQGDQRVDQLVIEIASLREEVKELKAGIEAKGKSDSTKNK